MSNDQNIKFSVAFSNIPRKVYKYLSIDGSEAMLLNSTLKFTNPSSFNDPYDCFNELIKFENIPDSFRERVIQANPIMSRKQKRFLLKNPKSSLNSDIKKACKEDGMAAVYSSHKVSCFSREANNLLMWSHYTDSHKGVCIGFDFILLNNGLTKLYNDNVIANEIYYTDAFESFDYFTEKEKAISNWMRTKSKSWEYEKEIRLSLYLKTIKNDIFVPFDKDAVIEILLGSKINLVNESKIKDICKETYPNAKIYKMYLDKNSFNLLPKSIK